MLNAYVELPSLHMFAGLLARDNYHKLRDLSSLHPFLQLGHDLLDVGFDLVVGRNCYEVRAVDVG